MRQSSAEATSAMSTDDDTAGGEAAKASPSELAEPQASGDLEMELLAQLAEAEAAEAEADAVAARAKATALRLRESDRADAPEVSGSSSQGSSSRGSLSQRRIWLAVALVLISGFLTASGLMVWQHQKAVQQKQRAAEYVAAAEKGVVALLSIDYNHAKDDVQRVIDLSTGSFKADFARDSDSWVKTAEESKSVTQGSISAAALESVNGDNGVVLLAASSKVTNANGAQQDPRAWRMSVTVTRDGDQLKMSNVEFVP